MTDRPLRIYLSGSIRKGRADVRSAPTFWSADDEAYIRELVSGRVTLLNPAKTPISRKDYFLNYGCDLVLVETADVVIADLRNEKGIGVGAELMYAQMCSVCVIGWIPPNSNYRRDLLEDVFGEDLDHWTHPFAFGLCDFIVDTLESACEHINRLRPSGGLVKDPAKTPERAKAWFAAKYPELAS